MCSLTGSRILTSVGRSVRVCESECCTGYSLTLYLYVDEPIDRSDWPISIPRCDGPKMQLHDREPRYTYTHNRVLVCVCMYLGVLIGS